MLISVFDSEWFNPTGIRLEYMPKSYSYPEEGLTRIILGMYSEKDDSPSYTPKPSHITCYNCVIVEGKTDKEVAEEINKQIKASKDD